MDEILFIANSMCALVSATLLLKIWRRDFFYFVFFCMFVLYSIVPMWGAAIYPELSQIVLNLSFEKSSLAQASLFTMLSLGSLYLSFIHIYTPISTPIRFDVQKADSRPGTLVAIVALYMACLIWGLIQYADGLNYSNANDEQFLSEAGLGYRLFWTLYKYSPFMLLCLYALARSKEFLRNFNRFIIYALGVGCLLVFLLITASVGSRTDPLALALGLIGYEHYYRRNLAGKRNARASDEFLRLRSILSWKFLGFSCLTVGALTVLEASRAGGTLGRNDLELSAITQAILLKDYYWPFHVLIGAIAYQYVDPATAITSNFANSLMFLGVDYLQYFIVENWAPDTVTRASSPAMYAFTEGFVMLGWLGFLYNGVVWGLGLGIWRLLARTSDEKLNCLAFALAIALAATIARSQSSYLIKDIYLWFLPSLALYMIATGTRAVRFFCAEKS